MKHLGHRFEKCGIVLMCKDLQHTDPDALDALQTQGADVTFSRMSTLHEATQMLVQDDSCGHQKLAKAYKQLQLAPV